MSDTGDLRTPQPGDVQGLLQHFLEQIVNVSSNVTAVEFARDSTRLDLEKAFQDASKVTFSIWVYIPTDSVKQAEKDADEMKNKNSLPVRASDENTLKRIPVFELGHSREVTVGIGLPCQIMWMGILGQMFWWTDAAPQFLIPFWQYWIGAQGDSPDDWHPIGPSTVHIHNEVQWVSMWGGNSVMPFPFTFGTSVLGAASDFGPKDDLDQPTKPPIPNYNFFRNGRINEHNVTGSNGGNYPIRPYSHVRALPTTWTWRGRMEATDDFPLANIKKGDRTISASALLLNYWIYFDFMYQDPIWHVNKTIQKTPTTGPSEFHNIRVEEGGPTGRYFAYAQMVARFPKFEGYNGRPITYASATLPTANPSGVYVTATAKTDTGLPDGKPIPGGSGSVMFVMSGDYPVAKPGEPIGEGGNTSADENIVPTLTWSQGGFVLDSWNQIFFTCDLTGMDVDGGFSNLLQTFQMGKHLLPPDMVTPPKSAFIVNGKISKGPPSTAFCVYMDKGVGKFKMQGGMFGIPLIKEEFGRYKMTGKSQKIRYYNLQIWFDKYIAPTDENLKFFYRKSKNKKGNSNGVRPAAQDAAVEQFGKPNIWLYRDRNHRPGDQSGAQDDPENLGILFQKNHGTAGQVTLTNPKPKDYRPGPGQSAKVSDKTS